MNDVENHKSIADGVEHCKRKVPKLLLMSQNTKIDSSVRKNIKMKFTKNNSIEKHLVHVVNEEFGSESTMDDESNNAIEN